MPHPPSHNFPIIFKINWNCHLLNKKVRASQASGLLLSYHFKAKSAGKCHHSQLSSLCFLFNFIHSPTPIFNLKMLCFFSFFFESPLIFGGTKKNEILIILNDSLNLSNSVFHLNSFLTLMYFFDCYYIVQYIGVASGHGIGTLTGGSCYLQFTLTHRTETCTV